MSTIKQLETCIASLMKESKRCQPCLATRIRWLSMQVENTQVRQATQMMQEANYIRIRVRLFMI
jgi:hypothetical protein